MSLAGSIAPHIPYLRRYARALTGSQKGGDSYVEATLQAIITDPSSVAAGHNPRTGLYRVFSQIWNSLDINSDTDRSGRHDADQRIEAITPRPRQAFLLTSVEGFPLDEAAAVLDCDLAELQRLITRAGEEISEQVATDVLIIEDEPIIALDLEALVEDLGHTVIGVARTHTEALELVRERRPGLVLADIQLADGSSGLEAVNEMLGSFEVPVVFITAYPERLLTGERPEPAFLITKPFAEATVRAVSSQALFFKQNARSGGRAAADMGTNPAE